MIAPRKKPLVYFFLPSFDNTNDRLCRETLGTLRTRQRRRQWKRRWKIVFAPFETLSPLNQVTQLFESREARSELKRGGCVRVQREREGERESKIYRLAVSVLKSNQNLVISRCSFAGTAKKCTTKRDARVELLFCSLNVPFFWRSRCRRRRSFVSSLLLRSKIFATRVTWRHSSLLY